MSDDGRVDLADFLLARIAEDEAVARAATQGPWVPEDQGWETASGKPFIRAPYHDLVISDEDRQHVTAWRPERVLAECVAKRVVISLCQTPDPHTAEEAGDGCTECAVLYTMAAVYRDHPDYSESWRP